jgi:hypothetical protein
MIANMTLFSHSRQDETGTFVPCTTSPGRGLAGSSGHFKFLNDSFRTTATEVFALATHKTLGIGAGIWQPCSCSCIVVPFHSDVHQLQLSNWTTQSEQAAKPSRHGNFLRPA